eukprot:TRINITY_DN3968_c1_g1_i1.p1 TRINITY_DN3968_c1_g1~~TRINITY_DN3968_c1_g1_i1.p1  ORF type:complete len:832 (-),score=192.13 TRINITY_DN3968_c1_g1_i1:236-2530(-)
MVLPIPHQGKAIGAVYLENNLATGVFRSCEGSFLSLLCSQLGAGVTIARSYSQQLERQRELEETNARIATAHAASTRFVPATFLKRIGRANTQEVQLGDAVEDCYTVMFTDVRGFTAISDRMSASRVFKFLNRLLAVIVPCVLECDGTVDKVMGDGTLCLFKRADNAFKAARMIQRAVRKLNEDSKQDSELLPEELARRALRHLGRYARDFPPSMSPPLSQELDEAPMIRRSCSLETRQKVQPQSMRDDRIRRGRSDGYRGTAVHVDAPEEEQGDDSDEDEYSLGRSCAKPKQNSRERLHFPLRKHADEEAAAASEEPPRRAARNRRRGAQGMSREGGADVKMRGRGDGVGVERGIAEEHASVEEGVNGEEGGVGASETVSGAIQACVGHRRNFSPLRGILGAFSECSSDRSELESNWNGYGLNSVMDGHRQLQEEHAEYDETYGSRAEDGRAGKDTACNGDSLAEHAARASGRRNAARRRNTATARSRRRGGSPKDDCGNGLLANGNSRGLRVGREERTGVFGEHSGMSESGEERDEKEEEEEEGGDERWPEVHIGIGIHSGPVLLGCLGTADRLDATCVGDTVNQASRVEQLTKSMGAEILASDKAVRAALHECGELNSDPLLWEHGENGDTNSDDEGRRDSLDWSAGGGAHGASAEADQTQTSLRDLVRDLGRVKVKGKAEPMWVYQVFEDPHDLAGRGELKRAKTTTGILARRARFRDARIALGGGQHAAGCQILQALKKECPHDKVLDAFLGNAELSPT